MGTGVGEVDRCREAGRGCNRCTEAQNKCIEVGRGLEKCGRGWEREKSEKRRGKVKIIDEEN